MMPPQNYTATIVSKEKVTPKVYLVTFSLSQPLHFTAGQTIMFQVASGVNRSMSIASPPSHDRQFVMCHDITPMGPFSRWTINVQVGDHISIVGPLGVFTLDKTSHRKKILVATGTGIAPFRSMLYDYLENGGTEEISLYWGLRFAEDLFWQDEFTGLVSRYSNFHYDLILSKPASSWQGKAGHVTDYVLAEKNLINCDFYLCGNRQMVKDLKEKLLAQNVSNTQIKIELFY